MNTDKPEKEMCSPSGVLAPFAVVVGPMNSIESCTYTPLYGENECTIKQ